MENEIKKEDLSMEIEDREGNADDDTVPQSTKDSTNGKSTTHQSFSTAPSTSIQKTNKFTWIYTSMFLRLQRTKDHLKSS
jgi:hypothetical protein